MILEALVDLDPAFGGGSDQVNPSPGRFGFQAERTVSRTLIQTQATMDALIKLREIQTRHFSRRDVRFSSFYVCQTQTFVRFESRCRVSSWEAAVLTNARPET